MLDTWTRGNAPNTHQMRVRYATWRIVDQIVGQRLWIRLGQDGDKAGHGLDTIDRFYGIFSSLGLKNP